MKDLDAAIKRRNHNSFSSRESLLRDLVMDDVKAGFQVLITINDTRK